MAMDSFPVDRDTAQLVGLFVASLFYGSVKDCFTSVSLGLTFECSSEINTSPSLFYVLNTRFSCRNTPSLVRRFYEGTALVRWKFQVIPPTQHNYVARLPHHVYNFIPRCRFPASTQLSTICLVQ